MLAKRDHLCQYKYRSVSPRENTEFYGYFREILCVCFPKGVLCKVSSLQSVCMHFMLEVDSSL